MTRLEHQLPGYTSVEDALADLCSGLCSSDVACRHCTNVAAEDLPGPFSELLVHDGHMTSRLRDYHSHPLTLKVLAETYEHPLYRRKIVLTLQGTDHVVEFGVVRIDFRFAPGDAQEAILKHRVPLGDILMSCYTLRRIQPRWYIKLAARCPIFAEFCEPDLTEVYGRIGTIYCDEAPAVEVLEVVTRAGPASAKNPKN